MSDKMEERGLPMLRASDYVKNLPLNSKVVLEI